MYQHEHAIFAVGFKISNAAFAFSILPLAFAIAPRRSEIEPARSKNLTRSVARVRKVKRPHIITDRGYRLVFCLAFVDLVSQLFKSDILANPRESCMDRVYPHGLHINSGPDWPETGNGFDKSGTIPQTSGITVPRPGQKQVRP